VLRFDFMATAPAAALPAHAPKLLVSQALTAAQLPGGYFTLHGVRFNRVWLQARVEKGGAPRRESRGPFADSAVHPACLLARRASSSPPRRTLPTCCWTTAPVRQRATSAALPLRSRSRHFPPR
jgi:hypothetical protein